PRPRASKTKTARDWFRGLSPLLALGRLSLPALVPVIRGLVHVRLISRIEVTGIVRTRLIAHGLIRILLPMEGVLPTRWHTIGRRTIPGEHARWLRHTGRRVRRRAVMEGPLIRFGTGDLAVLPQSPKEVVVAALDMPVQADAELGVHPSVRGAFTCH